jgi:hypothetical protein
MSVLAPAGRGGARLTAVTDRDSKTTVVITITVEDSAPIEVTDSYPMDEVQEVITFEDSYPASMPPLGENTQPAEEEDPPEIRATQAALDEARSKLDAADARLAVISRAEKVAVGERAFLRVPRY